MENRQFGHCMMQPNPGSDIVERLDRSFAAEDLPALWARASEPNTGSYRMCGRTLRLRCDSAGYARRFEQAFYQLRHDGDPSQGPVSTLTFLTRAAGPDGFPALIDLHHQRLRVFAHAEVLPTQLFFVLAFIEKLMFALADHIILHGSVVEHGGAVTALVGRTYSGKTSLGLRLALEPGVGFLSDEFCPIRLADGVVEPFLRCLGLRRHTRSWLAEKGALPADLAESASPQLEVDPLAIRGPTLGRGGPIRNIVVLSGEGISTLMDNVRLLNLPFVNPSVLADLRALAGVRAVRVLGEPGAFGTTVRIEVEERVRVTKELLRVCRDIHGMQLVDLLPPGACRPTFTNPPALTPLPALRGIVEMLRHLANVVALDSRLGGGYPRLLDCLAARLGTVRFFSLQPGPLEETSRLVHRRVLLT
jgi:hypothetical protein